MQLVQVEYMVPEDIYKRILDGTLKFGGMVVREAAGAEKGKRTTYGYHTMRG